MTRITVKVGPGAKLVRQGLQNLMKETPLVGRSQIYKAMQRIQKRMKESGDKPKYPIQWDSEKQRRAFFATDGFGGGIPHQRTGAYQSGMIIERLDNGYRFVSSSPAAPFVGGDAFGLVHSEINKPQDWPILRDVVDEELEQLPSDIQAELQVVARRNGFK